MNPENNIFKLIFTLSQLSERVKIIKIFFEGLNELFKPEKFFFSESKPQKAPYFEEIISRNVSYGYIVSGGKPSKEIITSIQNAVQMLAVVLDRLRMENELKNKARSLESVAQKRLEAIEANVLELENSRRKSLSLIKGLKKEIVQRQKIENELRESEEKFRLSFYTNPDSIALSQLKDGVYIEVNQGFTNSLGYTSEEVIGRSALDLNIWADPKERKILTEHLKKHSIVNNFQAKFRKKDGSIIDGLMSASIITLNHVQHIITIARDISDIKKAQEDLEKSELMFRKAFENSTSGMCIVSTEGKFLQVNPKLCEIMGYSPDELISKKFPDVTHPEDIEMGWENIRKIIAGEKDSFNLEKRYIRKNGEVIWGDVSASIIRGSGNAPDIFITHIYDISEKKKAEENIKKERDQAQRYLDIAGVMINTLNINGDILMINKKGCEILGYKKSEELLGKNWFDLCLPMENKEEVKQIFNELMVGNIENIEYYENSILTKTGERRLVGFHNTVLYDTDGKATGILSSGEDITEREQARKSLMETQHQLSTIYNTVDDVIFYLKVEGEGKFRFVTVNNMFCETTGLKKGQIEGKNVREVIPEPSLSLVLENYRKAIKQKSIVRWEENTPYPEGLKTGIVSVSPVFDNEGECSFLVGSVHDITERGKAEEEIKKLNAELEQRVIERTSELERTNKELEEVNDVFVGREMRIIELKEEVEKLKNKLKEK